jgi:hypothetical protein
MHSPSPPNLACPTNCCKTDRVYKLTVNRSQLKCHVAGHMTVLSKLSLQLTKHVRRQCHRISIAKEWAVPASFSAQQRL